MKTRRFHFFTVVVLVLGGMSMAGYGSADSPKGTQSVPAEQPDVIKNQGKLLPRAQRFVILPTFNNEAVLDNATGLVWERSPQTTSVRWVAARRNCIEKTMGGQKGWRLPSLEELTSLVDFSIAPPGPTLPPGHPFLTVQSTVYWSATRVDEDAKGSWAVHFGLGGGATFINWAHSVSSWCVRDGINPEQH